MELTFRKANENDLSELLALYRGGVESMLKSGIKQWDNTYPNEEVISKDILNSDLYLCLCDDTIAAAYALNCEVEPDYETGSWQHPDAKWIAMHRLCVSPRYHRKGIATACMLNIEKDARAMGFDAIHLDTFSGNPKAMALYDKLGYTQVGDMFWTRGRFVLFEKKL